VGSREKEKINPLDSEWCSVSTIIEKRTGMANSYTERQQSDPQIKTAGEMTMGCGYRYKRKRKIEIP